MWPYTLVMNSNYEGYNRSRELIELYVTLTFGAVLIGWILYSPAREAAADAAGSNAPEIRAADAAPPPQRDAEPSVGQE